MAPNMNPKKMEMPVQDPMVRNANFKEVALGYTVEMAQEEANRCLNCKTMPCVSGCPVNVKIPDLYNMGYTRNGCMYCGFGVQLEPPEINRYKRLKETHPLQYAYFIDNFGGLIIQCDVAV